MRVASLLACAAVVAAAAPLHRARADEPAVPGHELRRSAQVMGTVVSLQIWTTDDDAASAAAEAVFAELRRIDALMTTWTTDSEVSRVNAGAGGKPVAVSAELYGVIARAIEMSRWSDGAFDITVGAYQGLWKFDEDRDGSIPPPAAVRERLALVGWKRVKLDAKKKTVQLARKGMKITLGGIAKGYGVDRGVAILRERGVTDFVLQAGGDLYVSGKKGPRRWRVGIRDPRGARGEPFALAEIEDMTFSTSGDYERYVIVDGVRYHHILDPRTGQPARACRSVTVMAKDAITADAMSKPLFILGPERGMKLLATRPGVEAVFVCGDNQITVSPGLQGKLTMLHAPKPGP